MDYYEAVTPEDLGCSTGWKSLDVMYKVVPGELTLVTGVPNSGKSEWVDALAVNLSLRYCWPFAFCSMENKVRPSTHRNTDHNTTTHHQNNIK